LAQSLYQDAIACTMINLCMALLLDLQEEQTVNFALAGLLHNVGLMKLPFDETAANVIDLHKGSSAQYTQYPQLGVSVLRSRKIPLPVDTADAITQHREDCSGQGFPFQLPEAKIGYFGRLMAITYDWRRRLLFHPAVPDERPSQTLRALVEANAGQDWRLDRALLQQLQTALEEIENAG
jgi:HD-GYP domain-containing protein (c-di-GMP phosphodiesterase class II)